MAENLKGPYRSESVPLKGPITIVTMDVTAINIPAWAGFIDRP
jgi:hypothetical protein